MRRGMGWGWEREHAVVLVLPYTCNIFPHDPTSRAGYAIVTVLSLDCYVCKVDCFFCELGYFDGTLKIIVRGTTGQILSSGFSVSKYEGIIYYSLTLEFSIVFLVLFEFMPS
jgi:hypothetical protein